MIILKTSLSSKAAAIWQQKEGKIMMEERNRRRRKILCTHYFTLIELLVVIVIITILAALLFPVLSKAKEMGRKAVCSGNMRQHMQIVLAYSEDHKGYIPGARIQKRLSSGSYWFIQSMSEAIYSTSGFKQIDPTKNPRPKLGFFVCPSRGNPESTFTTWAALDESAAGIYNRAAGYYAGALGHLLESPWPKADGAYLQRVKRPSRKIYLTEGVGLNGLFTEILPGTLGGHSYEATATNWIKMVAAASDNSSVNSNTAPGILKDFYMGRHNRTQNVSFLDGHLENFPSMMLRREQLYSSTLSTTATDAEKAQSMFNYYHY